MNPRWEESEYVFLDLTTVAAYIQRANPAAARAFVHAAYDNFEFLLCNPGLGRAQADLGFPEVRSWRIRGFRRCLIFYRELPNRIQIWRVLHGQRDLHQTLRDQ